VPLVSATFAPSPAFLALLLCLDEQTATMLSHLQRPSHAAFVGQNLIDTITILNLKEANCVLFYLCKVKTTLKKRLKLWLNYNTN